MKGLGNHEGSLTHTPVLKALVPGFPSSIYNSVVHTCSFVNRYMYILTSLYLLWTIQDGVCGLALGAGDFDLRVRDVLEEVTGEKKMNV